jgi:cytochrome c oxidase subunit 3
MAEAHAKQHDYHLVDPSPWPIVGAVGALSLAVGTVMFFVSKKAGNPQLWYVLPGLLLVIFTMFGWWRDVIKEANEGYETPVVQLHLRYGMILFIASEVMFFVLVLGLFRRGALSRRCRHLCPHAGVADSGHRS